VVKPTPLIAGNWKLNKGTAAEAEALAREVASAVEGVRGVGVIVCPPFTVFGAAKQGLAGSDVALGAQDCFWKSSGAYTGQIAPEMLVDAGVSYVILGHSERRGRYGVPEPDFDEEILRHFGESDATVNRKTHAALAAGLSPIVCVGETLAEREAGSTDAVVREQVTGALAGIPKERMGSVVFAYEPVWARLRVQYGGSMKPDNAADLLARPNINGGLIGGASLKAADFAAIVKAAVQ